MKRRIEEADGYGVALERLNEPLEVGLLHGLDFGERGFSLFNGVGADHLAECADTRRARRTYARYGKDRCPCAESRRLLGVCGVSALVRTPSALYLSASAMIRPK